MRTTASRAVLALLLACLALRLAAQVPDAGNGKPVMGQEWRGGELVPVPLRSGEDEEARQARAEARAEERAARQAERERRAEEARRRREAEANQKRWQEAWAAREQERRAGRQILRANLIRLSAPFDVNEEKPKLTVRPGTGLFGQPSGPEVTLTESLGTVRTPGSQIPLESLQRAAAILQYAAGAKGEEASFLAGQAALAMDGAPLEVDVRPGAGALSPEQVTELAGLVEEGSRLREELDAATATRLDSERNLTRLGALLKEDAADKAELNQQLPVEYARYQLAYHQEDAARDGLAENEKKVRKLFVPTEVQP